MKLISIRTKIVLPYLLLAFFILGGAGFIGTRIVSDSIEERFVNQLIEAGKLSTDWLAQEEDGLLATARLLNNMEGVALDLRAADAEKLRELILPVVVNNREESVVILDTGGLALLSLYHRDGGNLEDYEFSRGEDSFKNLPLVQQVLARRTDSSGDKYAAVVYSRRGAFLYVSSYILGEKGEVVGAVLIGKSVNTLVRETREQTLAQVTLYDQDGRIIATTLAGSQPLNAAILASLPLPRVQASFLRDLDISDIAYREIIGSWQVRRQPAGLVGVSFAKNFLVRVSQNTWIQALISMLFALGLVLGIGFYVSQRISQPILELERATLQVAGGDLQAHVQSAGRDEISLLAQHFNAMVDQLYLSQKDLAAAYDSTLEGWVRTLDLRDHETTGHSKRVVEMTLRLVSELGIKNADLDAIRRGALLHDIGKIGVPDQILYKPGPLSEEEWRIMRQHPVYARQILEGIPFLKSALDIPVSHHERWDGQGYPKGLRGDQIPLVARVFSIVDVWDAITSDRPYRRAMSQVQARQIVVDGTGSQFDPQIVPLFMHLVDSL
jgi:putative nucleotidyltransferase with HDIG domain